MQFIVIIPARYSSSRLPGKPLKEICGKSMIERVALQAKKSGATRVVVATDSQKVADAVNIPGVEVCMTSPDHSSGTERLAEVCSILKFSPEEIIVNVQGDEPLIPPALINQTADVLASSDAPMATLAVPISDPEEIFNPNAVKVVFDEQGNALYFSRAPVPYDRDSFAKEQCLGSFRHYRHLGIYAYRAGFLQQFVSWNPSALENCEKLEQLRVLDHGRRIQVAVASEIPPAGVDTQEDLEKVIAYVKAQGDDPVTK